MVDCNVIATGSSGNATLINGNILIDCGVPFKSLEDISGNLKIVFLTHFHGDHFNKSTVKKLAKERPSLLWVCGNWMVKPLLDCGVDNRRIIVASMSTFYVLLREIQMRFEAFPLFHDVENCGWKLFLNDARVLYATDTSTIDHIEAKNFDLYLIEGNHKEAELKAKVEAKLSRGEYAYEIRAPRTHLSEEQAMDWIAKNAGPNSRYILMHKHKDG